MLTAENSVLIEGGILVETRIFGLLESSADEVASHLVHGDAVVAHVLHELGGRFLENAHLFARLGAVELVELLEPVDHLFRMIHLGKDAIGILFGVAVLEPLGCHHVVKLAATDLGGLKVRRLRHSSPVDVRRLDGPHVESVREVVVWARKADGSHGFSPAEAVVDGTFLDFGEDFPIPNLCVASCSVLAALFIPVGIRKATTETKETCFLCSRGQSVNHMSGG